MGSTVPHSGRPAARRSGPRSTPANVAGTVFSLASEGAMIICKLCFARVMATYRTAQRFLDHLPLFARAEHLSRTRLGSNGRRVLGRRNGRRARFRRPVSGDRSTIAGGCPLDADVQLRQHDDIELKPLCLMDRHHADIGRGWVLNLLLPHQGHKIAPSGLLDWSLVSVGHLRQAASQPAQVAAVADSVPAVWSTRKWLAHSRRSAATAAVSSASRHAAGVSRSSVKPRPAAIGEWTKWNRATVSPGWSANANRKGPAPRRASRSNGWPPSSLASIFGGAARRSTAPRPHSVRHEHADCTAPASAGATARPLRRRTGACSCLVFPFGSCGQQPTIARQS